MIEEEKKEFNPIEFLALTLRAIRSGAIHVGTNLEL